MHTTWPRVARRASFLPTAAPVAPADARVHLVEDQGGRAVAAGHQGAQGQEHARKLAARGDAPQRPKPSPGLGAIMISAASRPRGDKGPSTVSRPAIGGANSTDRRQAARPSSASSASAASARRWAARAAGGAQIAGHGQGLAQDLLALGP